MDGPGVDRNPGSREIPKHAIGRALVKKPAFFDGFLKIYEFSLQTIAKWIIMCYNVQWNVN